MNKASQKTQDKNMQAPNVLHALFPIHRMDEFCKKWSI